MICPFCETANRDERDTCYHCNKDLAMLRLIVNKAKHHYNLALEHAERGRNEQAMLELQNALDLDNRLTNAHIVLGAIYARQERFDEAREQWIEALSADPSTLRAHEYLNKGEVVRASLPALRFYRSIAIALGVALLAAVAAALFALRQATPPPEFRRALASYRNGHWGQSQTLLEKALSDPRAGESVRLSAELLNEALTTKVRSQREAAELAVMSQDFLQAWEALSFLSRRDLGGDMAEKIAQIRDSLGRRAETEFNRLLEEYRETGYGYGRIESFLDRLEEAQRKGLRGIDLARLRALAEKTPPRAGAAPGRFEPAYEAARIQAQWLRDKSNETALLDLDRLERSLRGALPAEAAAFQLRALASFVKDCAEGIDERLAAGKYADAKAFLQERVELFPDPLRSRIRKDLGAVEERIVAAEGKGLWTRLSALYSAEEWDEFLAAAAQTPKDRLSAEQRKTLEARVERARRASLEQFISRCAGTLDRKFSAAPGREVPRADAERLTREWDAIAAQIAPDDAYRRRQFEFFRAASALILGRPAEAGELFRGFLARYGQGRKKDYVSSAQAYLEWIERAEPAATRPGKP